MARNRERTKTARVRAQRAYVARQRAARSPSIGAIYKAMAEALYTANRTGWWKQASPEVRRAILQVVDDAFSRLTASGYADDAIRQRFKAVFALPDTPDVTGSAPTTREQVVLEQIKNDRKAA